MILGQQSLAQNVSIIHLDDFERRLSFGKDTTYVVNFWATWCAPCVKELPYFERLQKEKANEPLRVLLISLDFTEHIESRLIPFINRKALICEVSVLDEQDDNVWIPRVDPKWSGAIPATLFVNKTKKTRHFHEGSFKEGELKSLLAELNL
ncbi:MAG: thiol-disulfide isomerase/thioredoxin [Granulosicoccus sp.]|jgi:thiol-disulfide isomerase/thioredoxin